MTTFKTGSVLTTGTSVGDTAPGFTITFGSTAGNGVLAFQITDYLNAPIWAVPKLSNGSIAVYGDYNSAYNDVVSGSGMKLDGIRNPACLYFPNGTTQQGLRLWSGTGAPSTTTVGGAAVAGDLYIRIDTPSTSNQRIYQCTVAGTPGTWTARL